MAHDSLTWHLLYTSIATRRDTGLHHHTLYHPMPSPSQRPHRAFDVLSLHHDVIRFVCRDREDTHSGFGERHGNRCQDSNEREIQRAFDLERAPSPFALDTLRAAARAAHHR